MKSQQILEQIAEYEEIDSPVAESTLRFYISHGSFKVHEKINTLIVKHSKVVSEMKPDLRLQFMLKHLTEGRKSLRDFEVAERIREFLSEMINFSVDDDSRRKLLQALISLVEAIIDDSLKDSRGYEATLIDPIVTEYPEIANQNSYRYGSHIATMIHSSLSIIHGVGSYRR
ncbi:MAG: hypothetical protein H8F28_16900 [Fibrella sp.]|nr:hypothetical protein [Armatimonadota bacterium]